MTTPRWWRRCSWRPAVGRSASWRTRPAAKPRPGGKRTVSLEMHTRADRSPAAEDGTRRPGMIAPAALSVVLLVAFSLFTFVDPPAGDSEVNRFVTDIAAWHLWTRIEIVLDIL